MGFYLCATPYAYNQYTNHITRIVQQPDFTALNNAVTTYTVDHMSMLLAENNTKVETLIGTTYRYRNTSWTTYNTSWRYTYEVCYLNSGAGEVSSYCIDVWLQNTGWTDYYNDGTAIGYYDSDSVTTTLRESMGPNFPYSVILWT